MCLLFWPIRSPLGGSLICAGDAAQEGSHFLQRWTGRFKQTGHFEHCNKTRVIKLFVEILAKRKSWPRLYWRPCNYNCAAQLFGRALLLSRWSHTEVTTPKSLVGYRPVALTSLVRTVRDELLSGIRSSSCPGLVAEWKMQQAPYCTWSFLSFWFLFCF